MKSEKMYVYFSTVIIFVAIVASTRPKLPKLFLIGDSISIQYGPYLQQYLDGIAELERKENDGSAEKNLDVPTGANGGDSRMVLAYLRKKIANRDFKPDYLLLNCGLHDIKRDINGSGTQVDSAAYRQNLLAIHNLLAMHDIQLIWMRTTMVIDSVHNQRSNAFKRYAADLDAFNRIADEVCAAKKIPVIDLYSLSIALGREEVIDHVHYQVPARMAQAGYIAGFLQNYLTKR
ncbi:SGNH/GDSL hydrolase family protein [Parapedobacter indicus]|uniref:Lysophospholipase L1 n=1 Tax=Parapedobacter indicus TaxID=1477437 RepID=A0A1I3HIU7_9SPHI|nr:SGNH/GDSL hydrolase family protein [Parapedobacter indicus]PPL03052.1 lysophospholipase L1-like esterase [Parapedobacter indicus]SFI35487.1 Lysophospholipase L1 [Parapedobacter indicus]